MSTSFTTASEGDLQDATGVVYQIWYSFVKSEKKHEGLEGNTSFEVSGVFHAPR